MSLIAAPAARCCGRSRNGIYLKKRNGNTDRAYKITKITRKIFLSFFPVIVPKTDKAYHSKEDERLSVN
jgi:hypothetical protein